MKMKRIVALILSLVMCLSLCACGGNDAKTDKEDKADDKEAMMLQEAKEHAAEADKAIEAIGTVSLESKELITAARTAYDALTEDEKELVENLNTLTEAEAAYAELWEAEKQRIISEYSAKFSIDEDPVEGIVWYTPKNMPNYIDTRSYIIPYIGVSGNYCWICIRYNYTGDDWIFWESMTIVADGTKNVITIGGRNTTRDNDGGNVWEYYDEAITTEHSTHAARLEMLARIADSEETIVRFEGDNYRYDLYVTDADKEMIRDTLTLYEAMLG